MTISIAGMRASAARLAASASNLANVMTTGALPSNSAAAPTPYQPVDVVQTSLGETGGIAGVAVTFQPRVPAFFAAYDPDAAFADDRGMVAAPNVDFAQEAVSALEAAMSFRANLAALKVEAETSKEFLNVLA